MTRDEIAAIVTALGDLVQIVRDADPADKSKIYTQLGLTLTYQLRRRVVEATIKSRQNIRKGSVSEAGVEPIAHSLAFTTEFLIGMDAD